MANNLIGSEIKILRSRPDLYEGMEGVIIHVYKSGDFLINISSCPKRPSLIATRQVVKNYWQIEFLEDELGSAPEMANESPSAPYKQSSPEKI